MRSSLHRCIFPGLVISLAAVSGANAALLQPVHDNNVNRGAADTVQADGTTVVLKESSTSQTNARLGYLKFDLASLVPADGNDATLTITTTSATTTPFVLQAFALNAGQTGFDWTETAITYNNRPAFSTTGNLLLTTGVTKIGDDFNLPSGSAAGVQVPFSFSNLSSFAQADNTLTLIVIVQDQVDGGPTLSFASSENATTTIRPSLSVAPVPEPGGLALLAVAAAALLRRGARRTA